MTSRYTQVNEKQTVMMDTQRGMLLGTFRLGLIDANGKQWWTKRIPVNEELSSKATIKTGAATTVHFTPPLPYGKRTVRLILNVCIIIVLFVGGERFISTGSTDTHAHTPLLRCSHRW